MKFNLLLANGNGELNSLLPDLNRAIERAEQFINQKIEVNYNINMVIAKLDQYLVPEDGIGGRTIQHNFIMIAISSQKNPCEDILFETICHEALHAIRWSINPEYMQTLFDAIINESLAVTFEELALSAEKVKELGFFVQTITERSVEENKIILEKLKPLLGNEYYDTAIFYNGNDILPRWSAYSVGRYLIHKYLEITKQDITQVYANKYDDFKTVLSRELNH